MRSRFAAGLKAAGHYLRGAETSAAAVNGDWRRHDEIVDELMCKGAKSETGTALGAEITNAGAAERHKAWQDRADELWRDHPDWSKRSIAFQISRETGHNANTIRNRIKVPTR